MKTMRVSRAVSRAQWAGTTSLINAVHARGQSGLPGLSWALCLLALSSLTMAQDTSPPLAQDTPALPTPDSLSELSADPAEAPVQQWVAPLAQSRRYGHYGMMSDWDLYAGSVYANTSPLWLHAEGLLWWVSGNDLPPLVTTSPNSTPRAQAGVLGQPDTWVVHGDDRVDDRARGGFRTTLGVRLGHWFDHLMDSELEFGVLWVGDGQSSGDFYRFSAGDPILARPFLNAQTNLQDAQLVGFPDVVLGEISIQSASDLLSAGAWYRKAWRCTDAARIDWVAGYRYALFREQLLIEESLVSTDPVGPVAVGTTFDLYDDFRTWSEFHGADLGLQLWTHTHGWTVEVLGKIALGSTLQTLEIDGQTLVVPPVGGASLAQGGLLAMPTNIGRHQSNQFSVLPEVTVRLRRPISRFFTFTIGYTAMALNNVLRTGDQIDLAVNPTQFGNGLLVGDPRPALQMVDSVMWVQGITVGLEW